MGCVVNLNKPSRITSHQAVSRVKKTLGARKAGHAGTLDPLATGVLIICLDEATKVSRFLADQDKEYIATIRLGAETDTYDAEGRVTCTSDPGGITQADIGRALEGFRGEIEQIPPVYSAIKSGGEPLYRLARRGKRIEVCPRKVFISDIELLSFRLPLVSLRIECSKGTYIRSLAHDLGRSLGVGAHLAALVRTRVGRFSLSDAVELDETDKVKKGVIPMDEALTHMPEILLRDRASAMVRHGVPVELLPVYIRNLETLDQGGAHASFFRLKNEAGELLAIGQIKGGRVRVVRNFLTKPKEVF